jgi:hypothetical protein
VARVDGDTEPVGGDGAERVGERVRPRVVDLRHARGRHHARRALAVAVAHPLHVQPLGDALVASAQHDDAVEALGLVGAPAPRRADLLDLAGQGRERRAGIAVREDARVGQRRRRREDDGERVTS